MKEKKREYINIQIQLTLSVQSDPFSLICHLNKLSGNQIKCQRLKENNQRRKCKSKMIFFVTGVKETNADIIHIFCYTRHNSDIYLYTYAYINISILHLASFIYMAFQIARTLFFFAASGSRRLSCISRVVYIVRIYLLPLNEK